MKLKNFALAVRVKQQRAELDKVKKKLKEAEKNAPRLGRCRPRPQSWDGYSSLAIGGDMHTRPGSVADRPVLPFCHIVFLL